MFRNNLLDNDRTGLPALVSSGRVKAKEMFSDDFFRFVAFYALRAGVPGRNQAIRIQHVNGIITNGLHQQLKLLFGRRSIG
jgi:hypothetical protein